MFPFHPDTIYSAPFHSAVISLPIWIFTESVRFSTARPRHVTHTCILWLCTLCTVVGKVEGLYLSMILNIGQEKCWLYKIPVAHMWCNQSLTLIISLQFELVSDS